MNPGHGACARLSAFESGPRSHGSATACRSASDRVRPAFRECRRRCREGPPLALARPGLPLGLNAVADEARAERWYQYSAYAVAPVGDLVRLRVDEQRLADIEPS